MLARVLTALTLSSLALPSAQAQEMCGMGEMVLMGDMQSVSQAMFTNMAREVALEAASGAEEEQGGWWTFITTSVGNITFDGMLTRYIETDVVIDLVEAGRDPATLNYPPGSHRLRNVGEMTDVIGELPETVDNPAAYSLRDANMWFYILFGNEGGDFSGMDMEEYRAIGALPGDQAAEVLPEFEAELFRNSTDPSTVEFGNSLPAEERLQLFLLHNRYMTPDGAPRGGGGGGGGW